MKNILPTNNSVSSRLLTTFGIVVYLVTTLGIFVHFWRLWLSKSTCENMSYSSTPCINGVFHDANHYWIGPFFIGALSVFGLSLLLFCVATLVRWVAFGPLPKEYRCQLGTACPCVDHQDRILADNDSSNLATGIIMGAAIGSVINN
jgi:hypothetical protein